MHLVLYSNLDPNTHSIWIDFFSPFGNSLLAGDKKYNELALRLLFDFRDTRRVFFDVDECLFIIRINQPRTDPRKWRRMSACKWYGFDYPRYKYRVHFAAAVLERNYY